jgi:hypothetical protein
LALRTTLPVEVAGEVGGDEVTSVLRWLQNPNPSNYRPNGAGSLLLACPPMSDSTGICAERPLRELLLDICKFILIMDL